MQAGYRAPKKRYGAPTLSGEAEGNTEGVDHRENPVRLCGVKDPRHAWKLDAREPGDPGVARSLEKAAGRRENP
jgi:hypothetical protein